MSSAVDTLQLRLPEGPGFVGLFKGDQPEVHQDELRKAGYEQKEWTLRGLVSGQSFETVITVISPIDPSLFSGFVIAEPLHLYGVSTLWQCAGDYVMRSGHAWVVIAAQKVPLESFVKPSAPDRYESIRIPSTDTDVPDFAFPFDGSDLVRKKYWEALDAYQPSMLELIALGGSALRTYAQRLFGNEVAHMVLCGLSENAQRTTNFLMSEHARSKPSVFDGYLPVAFPLSRIVNPPAPVIQVIFEGDMADPKYAYRPGFEGRHYRRADSDDPQDSYRLYEFAGIPHSNTSSGSITSPDTLMTLLPGLPEGCITSETKLNSLPYDALVAAAMDHLVRWVADGTAPPRADRLELTGEELIAKDSHGNSRGGVRCAELDVPVATHRANAPDPRRREVSSMPFGTEEPFSPAELEALYSDEATYVSRYRSRLKELVNAGWLLKDDAAKLAMRAGFPLVRAGTTAS